MYKSHRKIIHLCFENKGGIWRSDDNEARGIALMIKHHSRLQKIIFTNPFFFGTNM
jgi:hypothetical protein